MEHCYVVKEYRSEPTYKNPIVVYVLELTISAYMLIVETANEVCTETLFFSSAEEAKGNGRIPDGAEAYFGKIATWEELRRIISILTRPLKHIKFCGVHNLFRNSDCADPGFIANHISVSLFLVYLLAILVLMAVMHEKCRLK